MSFDLQQQLGTQQTLSPQMRQGLELLQSSSLELEQIVQQAIISNPVLEQEFNEEKLAQEEIPLAENDKENLAELADDYREERILNQRSNQPIDEAAREHFYNSIVAPKTLQQHLLQQLNLASKPPAIYEAAQHIIGALNDRGYLTETLEEIAQREQINPDTLRNACSVIQHFHPAGVGAADIKESLLIQLQRKNIHSELEIELIENHLKDLSYKRYAELAKMLNVSLRKIIKAAENIRKLTPNPGAEFDPSYNPQIQPDIIVSFDQQGKLQAHLTEAHLPNLSINQEYKNLLASTADTKVRKYLKDNIRDGRSLIKSISQRQETLLKITEELLYHQEAFFKQGPAGLKPLKMNTIAEKIEIHPTTVSRAVTSKYIQTAHGLFEMRYFFTSGIENKDGKTVSNTSIKTAVEQIIATENPKKPYSDAAIANLLKKKNIDCARRTVAKYREQLGILSSSLRKQF